MKKLLSSFLLLYILLLTLFTLLVIAVHMIPRSAIEPQVKSSAEIFSQEGVYPYKPSLDGRVVVDNHTERNYRYRDHIDITVSMRHLLDGHIAREPFEYGKYWHGYLVFLRPLLTLLDYGKIRVLNGIVLTILLVIALYLLARRLSVGIALCFACCCASLPSVPLHPFWIFSPHL